jgi:hypothetical protein
MRPGVGPPDDDRVLVEVAERLATVTLNRPENTMLDWEALTMASIFQTDDLREAFTAFAEKREPRFTGR